MYDDNFRGDIRSVSADAHEGTARDFLDRHEAEAFAAGCQGRSAIAAFAPCLLKRIADTRNLHLAYRYLAWHGGPAPGPDGLTYVDLGPDDMWGLVRTLSRSILDGRYRPGPMRSVRVPKDGGGFRTILLGNISDRVVQRGVVQIVQPLVYPGFDPHSFCRFGRNRLHALARAEHLLRETGRHVLIIEDIKNAFGSVPVGRLIEVVKTRFPAEDFFELMTKLVTNGPGSGLCQGPPDSPLWMNFYLDHFVDRRWRKLYGQIPLLRYMDDFLLMGSHEEDAEANYVKLERLLREAGMPLKGRSDDPDEDPIRDLGRGVEARWLGFVISAAGNEMVVRLALDGRKNLLDRLRNKLLQAHAKPDSPLRATQAINGLLDQAGPCWPYSDHDAVYERIAAVARELAFEEALDRGSFVQRWEAAYGKWCKLREHEAKHEWTLDQMPGQAGTDTAESAGETEGWDEWDAPF